MVTLIKYGALSGGEKYNVNVLSIDGLSTDTKPIGIFIEHGSDGREVGRMGIPNGSIFTEIDTGDTYMYDADNTTWYQVTIGGGGSGGFTPTQPQLDAMNSGIDSTKVAQIETNKTNISTVKTDVDTLNHNSRQKVNLTITNGIYDRWNNLAASTGKHASITVNKGEVYYYEGYKYTNDYPAYLLRKNGAIVSYYNGVSSGLVFGNLKIEIPDGVDELILNSNNYVMELEKSVTVGTMPNSNWTGRKAVWFGTSIPETSTYNPYLGYPEYVAMKLGLDLTNEARGSSCARRGFRSQITENDPYGWTGMGYKAAFYNMGSTIAEKQELITNWDSKWKALVDPTHNMTQSDQTLAMHYTYENIIPEYINAGTELFIFDHGYNDWKNNSLDKSADENDFFNRSTYQGAMATMIKMIYELNPNARVLLISHYDGQQKAGLIEMQKEVSEAWQLPLCRLDMSLGWAYDRHVSVYGQWSSTSGGYWWKSSETANDFTLLSLNVPDSIHPNQDLRGHAVKAIGEVIAKWINSNVVPFQ